MYKNLEKRLDGSYTFEKNGMPYNCPNIGEWVEEFAQVHAWALANPIEVTQEVAVEPPPVLSLNEQAMLLSMPKLDFIEMAEALTANMPNPVTWASINGWMATNPEIQKLFILATEVKRNDPKLDEVTAMFGAEFLPFLDMMFVFKNEIQAEMTLAKTEGRPINLDALMTGLTQ